MQTTNISRTKTVTVGVLFGGRSVEHEVSIVTAHQAMEALSVSGFSVLPIYITKDGEWFAGDALRNLDAYRDPAFFPGSLSGVKRVFLLPEPGAGQLRAHGLRGLLGALSAPRVDIYFPALHGSFGEDGTLQGLLELAAVPYVGSGVFASACAIDKAATKQICRLHSVPVLESVEVSRISWETAQAATKSDLERKFGYPMMVKPAKLGSSIGVARCDNLAQLVEALEVALLLDERAVVERALAEFYEINVSVLGGEALRVSVCERPQTAKAVLSFDEKYRRGGKKLKLNPTREQGMAALDREMPARISEELTTTIQNYARTAFAAIGGAGVARVDFLVERQGDRVFLNEINTLPGSLAYYLWEASGLGFEQLVSELVGEGFARHQQRSRTRYSYNTNLLRPQ